MELHPKIQQQERFYFQGYDNNQEQVCLQTAFRPSHIHRHNPHTTNIEAYRNFANTVPHATARNSDVPGKGEREGEKRASQL